MAVESNTTDKQITVEVPEERVAEFYAFFGRFLAGRRRGPGHHRGHGRHGGHGRCGRGRHHAEHDQATPEPAERAGAGPDATVV